MRSRTDLDHKPVRSPVKPSARVVPIRPQPLPDPRILFLDTNHVLVKEDDGEQIVVFDGQPGHLLSLPHPGRGVVYVATHAILTVLGNGAKVDGQTSWELEAGTVTRYAWRYGSWWGLHVHENGAHRYLDLKRGAS